MSCVQIWVSSVHSASGYFTVYGDESSTEDHFDAHLATGDTLSQYCRTGYVGFVRRTEMTQSDGGDTHDMFSHCVIASVSSVVAWGRFCRFYISHLAARLTRAGFLTENVRG